MIKHALEKYTASIAIVMLALFVTFGVVYAASDEMNCGLGAAPKGEDGKPLHTDDGTGRKDDKYLKDWITDPINQLICTATKNQHNR